MTKDLISTIIKGKKVTGDDVGRLLLADMAEEYKTYLKTGQVKSIISQNEFNKLLNSLADNYQIERYNRYVCIHNTIKTYMSLNKGIAEGAINRLELYKRMISNIKTTLQADSVKNSMPLIVTQKQYDDLIERYSIKDVTFNCLDILTHALRTNISDYEYYKRELPELAEGVTDTEADELIEKYRKEAVKSLELKKLYNSLFNSEIEGYFSFKRAVISTGINREEFIHNCRLQNIKIKEKNASAYTKKELEKPIDKAFIEDLLTPEQIEEHIKFEPCNKVPETIHKIDLIKNIDELCDFFAEDTDTEKILNVFDLISKEIPEAIDLIKSRLSKYKCLKPYMNKKPKEMIKAKIKGEYLLSENIGDYNSWTKYSIQNDYPRAHNGIAIIKEDMLDKYDKEEFINEEGYYKDDDEDMELYNKLENNMLEHIEELGQSGVCLIKPLYENLKQVYAFNEFINIVAKTIDLPILKDAFLYDLDYIELAIFEYNKLLSLLLLVIIPKFGQMNKEKDYEEINRMRDSIFKALPYIDTELAKVTPENKAKAEEYISDINNFKGISAVSKPFYILTGCGN